MDASEYTALNTHIGQLTAVRVALRSEMVRVPIESPVERNEHGMPIRTATSGMPRPLYREAEEAIVAAEHALMRIRDRNGWSVAYEAFGRVAAMRER